MTGVSFFMEISAGKAAIKYLTDHGVLRIENHAVVNECQINMIVGQPV